MKTSTITQVSNHVMGAIALCLSLQLSTAPTAQAQTFTGENQLKKGPASLPALIYPANDPQTIRVNVDLGNRRGGPLTFVIRDGKGNTRHTQTIHEAKYKGRFDLSPLGAGTYTFELSNEAGQTYSRSFRIETSQPRVIALGDPNDKVFDLNDTLTVGLINH